MNRLKQISIALFAIMLAACGGQTPAAQNPVPTAASETAATPASDGGQVDKSKLSKELNIYNWADYIDPATLEAFTQEYGVKVNLDVYDNNEDMIAKVGFGTSGYDIVFPSDYAVDIMTKQKLVAPLDKTLLPNMKNLKPANLNLYYDKDNMFSLPYNLGMTGLGYNTSKFSAPVDSWATVFDKANLEKISGQVSMLDDERETPGAALYFLGKSVNETNAVALDQAAQILKDQKAFLSGYDSSNVSRRLASGEIVIGQIYSYNALQAKLGIEGDYSGNSDIAFAVPKEGATIWQDNMAIVASSSNIYTAHVFIDYMMRPDVSAKNSAYILGVTPNSAAESLLPTPLRDSYTQGFAPTDEMMKRLQWIERNDATAAFTDLWTAVKGE